MRVLVTGARGFVGRHVMAELARAGHAPIGADVAKPGETLPDALLAADLRDAAGMADLVRRLQPEGCIHLGGIAFVPTGWTDPEMVFSVNAIGTVHLLEAFRRHAPDARIVAVTSAEVYGRAPAEQPLTEDAPLRPDNLYAVSKMAADLSALLYARRYGLHALTARPGNHIGPGQSGRFVAPSFAEQLLAIKAGRSEPVIRVGNLDAERDFADVRDVARAYRLLLEKGRPGTPYNVASGRFVTIRSILEELCGLAGVHPEIRVDPERYRPTDRPPGIATRRILDDAGWRPEIPLSRTLADLLAGLQRGATGEA